MSKSSKSSAAEPSSSMVRPASETRKNTPAQTVRGHLPVPMLDLARQYANIGEEINEAVLRVCMSQQYVLGPEVHDFEKESAAYLSVGHAVGCASGTDALWLALLAGGIGPGDEVITTPFSFFASASSIVRAGARPIFVDIEADTLNLSAEAVERRVNQLSPARLKAIMPVHLYGQCADMDRINRIAADHKLTVIEDAAQAFGATWRGKNAGALGAIGAFSFYPTKNLSCYGDGGLVTTNDPAIADHLRRLRNHGSSRRYYHEEVGWNSRLDSLQAAILRIKLRHLNEWNMLRNQRATAYDVLLQSSGLLAERGAKGASRAPMRILSRRQESFHIFHQYVVVVERRDELRQFLTERKIGSEVYYPVPLHLQECFGYLGYAAGDLPCAEKASREVLALPIYPEITAEEQASVVDALTEFFS